MNEIDDDDNHANTPNGITTTTGTNWADPKHDAAGNMTTMPLPKQPSVAATATYDAWNRLVSLEAGSSAIEAYEYDGLNQRIVRTALIGFDDITPIYATYDFYYNDEWQVLEERKNGDTDPLSQYVWHPYYVDALAVRYYDENTDNSGIVRHWYLQDANFNVTGVVNDSAAVLERYQYTPYGEVTFLEPDFDPIVGNATAIGNNILYTGRERDPETGLQLNRERFYHPPLGRWLTRDPIEYEGSSWNLYEYVYSQPLNGLDSSGLVPITPIGYAIPCGHVSLTYNLFNLRFTKVGGWCWGYIPDPNQTRQYERIINRLIGGSQAKSISYDCELGGYCCNLKPFRKRFRWNFSFQVTIETPGRNCVLNISGTIGGTIDGEAGNCQDCPCD